jgi:hypothetical protein
MSEIVLASYMLVFLLQVAHFLTASMGADIVHDCGSCKQGVPVTLLPTGTELKVVQKGWNPGSDQVSCQCLIPPV